MSLATAIELTSPFNVSWKIDGASVLVTWNNATEHQRYLVYLREVHPMHHVLGSLKMLRVQTNELSLHGLKPGTHYVSQVS